MEQSTKTTPTDSTSPDLKQPADTTSPTTPTTKPPTAAVDTPETKALNNKKLFLESRIASLRAQIEEVKTKRDEAKSQLRNPDAAVTVKRHIKLLHDYNEIRDVGTGLMGMIADSRGVRIKDVYAELGIDVKD